MDPATLSIGQQFELERMRRTIDGTTDVAELQQLAKMLLTAWQGQRAAAAWLMRQGLQQPWQDAQQAAREVMAGQQKGAPCEAPPIPTVES